MSITTLLLRLLGLLQNPSLLSSWKLYVSKISGSADLRMKWTQEESDFEMLKTKKNWRHKGPKKKRKVKKWEGHGSNVDHECRPTGQLVPADSPNEPPSSQPTIPLGQCQTDLSMESLRCRSEAYQSAFPAVHLHRPPTTAG